MDRNINRFAYANTKVKGFNMYTFYWNRAKNFPVIGFITFAPISKTVFTMTPI